MDEKFYEHKQKVGWYRKSVLSFGKCSGTYATKSAVAYRCQEQIGSPASSQSGVAQHSEKGSRPPESERGLAQADIQASFTSKA